jgi:predicted nucleotidyltransferase
MDISSSHLAVVEKILAQHVPGVEVWAFGSRVVGTAKKHSDLDLAVITSQPLETSFFGDLKEAFMESDLPFKVDVVDWAVTSGEFRKIIESKHEVIQR